MRSDRSTPKTFYSTNTVANSKNYSSCVVTYIVLLEVLLLVGLCVLQVFVDGCNLPLFIIYGLVQRFQFFFDPLVPLLLGSELTATALLGIQVCSLLRSLGQSGRKLGVTEL